MLYLDYAKQMGNGYILNFFADSVDDIQEVSNGKRFKTLNGTDYGVPMDSSTIVITMPDKTKKTFVLGGGEWNEYVQQENKLAKLLSEEPFDVAPEDIPAEHIPDYALYKTSVRSVTCPLEAHESNLIGEYACAECYGLISVRLPHTPDEEMEGVIGSYSFYDCQNLKTVTFTGSLSAVGEYAFARCYSIKTIHLPSPYIPFDSYTFSDCMGLTSITVSDGVPFWHADGAAGCFYNCRSLKDVPIIMGSTLSDQVFDGCQSLANITIGGDIASIGSKALYIGTAKNKATITFLKAVPPRISPDTFNAATLEKIIVPKGSGEAYKTADNWTAFASFIEEAAE